MNRLYVAGKGTSHITALDGSTCAIKQMIKTNGPVYGMFLAITGSSGTNGGTGNQLWYSTASALNIFQLPDKIQSIAIPAGPRYLTIPAGATVYATTRQDTVIAVSSQTLQVVSQPLLSGGNFGPMDYDAFTSEVYVPDRKHHQIDVLTPIYYGSSIPQEPNHVISLGGSPQSVAITSDGNLAFIALADGHIAMYDIFGKQMLNTIFVGGSTHFIITGLYPPAIGTTRQQAAAADIARTIGAYLLVSAIILLPLWFRWENPASVS